MKNFRKKSIYIFTLFIIVLSLNSCGSPQSKWNKEEVGKYIDGCFEGENDFGVQTTCFYSDGTWSTSYVSNGDGVTYGQKEGTWETGEFNEQYDWWKINLSNGSTTTISTSNIAGTTKIYMSGFGDVHSAYKDMPIED